MHDDFKTYFGGQNPGRSFWCSFNVEASKANKLHAYGLTYRILTYLVIRIYPVVPKIKTQNPISINIKLSDECNRN